MQLITWDVDWILVLQFIVATLLPLLVAIVSTKVTSAKVKGLLLAVFSFLATVITAILDALVNQTPLDLGQTILLAGGTFAWAVVSYFGIWRAQGTDGAPSIAAKLTDGVGRVVVVEEQDPGSRRTENPSTGG